MCLSKYGCHTNIKFLVHLQIIPNFPLINADQVGKLGSFYIVSYGVTNWFVSRGGVLRDEPSNASEVHYTVLKHDAHLRTLKREM